MYSCLGILYCDAVSLVLGHWLFVVLITCDALVGVILSINTPQDGVRGSNGDPIKNIFISATVHLPYRLNSHSLTLSKLHLKIKFTFL